MSALLHLFDQEIQVENYHDDFLLLKSTDGRSLTRIGRALFARNFDFIEEVIVTETEICLRPNEGFSEEKLAALAELTEAKSTERQTYTLPVWFGEEADRHAVCTALGRSDRELINQLLRADFTVAMFGFLPGFLYLSGLPAALHLPRKSVPAKQVPAGALALGGRYAGLYPTKSPGGWHIVGRTPVTVLQPESLPPVAVELYDRLRLTEITAEEYQHLLSQKLTIKTYHA